AGDVINSAFAIGLKPNESLNDLAEKLEKILSKLPADAQFIVLADIIGGSPLTTVCNVLHRHGQLRDSLVLGGMNFPMALTAMMSKDSMAVSDLKDKIISEATGSIKQFDISLSSGTSDENI
ncbi:PTS fructose transporter subunit IIA, partial [Oenococcus alcoholitolerans]